ncbi:MAG: D-alanyl-D-alanine carboxypeptidase, partial [Alphaproteobacteria bacterium]
EEEFAKLMTVKAGALGMLGTTYVNASGLPAEAQITTARDQAVLGRAIQHRFPVYYQYFATPSFRYKGAEMRNHNNLLGQVKGVDGIKTGYTEASGYNLTSRMRQLIEAHISLASTQRTAPIIVEAGGQENPHQENPHQDIAHQGDALQGRADVVAVAPATPDAEPSAAGPSEAAAAGAKADPVPVPRPRLQAARLPARASKRAATAQALPARGQRLTAKASTLGVLHVERRVAPSAPLQ